jgi:hypothetical protein
MEIDDKGGEVETKICQYTKRERFRKRLNKDIMRR